MVNGWTSARPRTAAGTVRLFWFGLAVAAGTCLQRPSTAVAHETDQFTLPADGDFADLGPDVTGWYYQLLANAAGRANARIGAAIRGGQSAEAVAKLQSPVEVVNAVDQACLRGNDIVDALESVLASPAFQRRHPGRRTCFRQGYSNIYEHAFWPWQPQILSRFWFGSTVRVFGHLVGTDKFGHFTAIGVSYYWRYAGAQQAGADERAAMAEAVRFGTEGKWSEADLMGLTTTGDYANGDLSANYAGLLFFRNLTEPTRVAGIARPPLLVRDGSFWRLADHVRPDSGFLRPFITDHWNEALNPGYFMPSMRPALRDAVRARTSSILRWYAPPASVYPSDRRAYLRDRRLDLQTYWGEDYGHRGDDDSLVTIDNACFEAAP